MAIVNTVQTDINKASSDTLNTKQDKLKTNSGSNITIDANDTISKTDTKLTAGEGITISNNQISTQGGGVNITVSPDYPSGGKSGDRWFKIKYSITNLIPDPSFENNQWSGTNYSTTEYLFGSRSQYFASGGVYVGTIPMTAIPIVGHKYYGRHYLKSSGDNQPADCRFEWFGGDGVGLNFVFGWNRGNFPDWTMESSIIEITDVNTKSFNIRSFVVNSTADMWADGLMIIDLTASFGAGNEPTKEWCDANIPFFEGTITI